jgi:hypothetical protein
MMNKPQKQRNPLGILKVCQWALQQNEWLYNGMETWQTKKYICNAILQERQFNFLTQLV